jgi:hypothetical protein
VRIVNSSRCRPHLSPRVPAGSLSAPCLRYSRISRVQVILSSSLPLFLSSSLPLFLSSPPTGFLSAVPGPNSTRGPLFTGLLRETSCLGFRIVISALTFFHDCCASSTRRAAPRIIPRNLFIDDTRNLRPRPFRLFHSSKVRQLTDLRRFTICSHETPFLARIISPCSRYEPSVKRRGPGPRGQIIYHPHVDGEEEMRTLFNFRDSRRFASRVNSPILASSRHKIGKMNFY